MEDRTQPTVTHHWRRELDRRDSSELFALAEQLEKLEASPGWIAVTELVAQGRESLLASLLNGPTRSGKGYARQLGYLQGLAEVGNVVAAIREAAARRQDKLKAAADAESAAAEEES